MRRVGLFLGAPRSTGGSFQYCQAMLEAFAALPRDRFDPVVALAADDWAGPLGATGLAHVRASPGLPGQALARVWEAFRLPASAWRRMATRTQALARTLAGLQADLWVFPAQERWTYRLPLPAVGVVHDLMHRYERRFPEVGSASVYRAREHRYRSLCAWARGILVDSETGRQQLHASYGYPLQRTHVLPYAPPGYIRLAARPPDFDQRYALPPKYVFYPAQFWQHKNHNGLVRAAASLVGRHPDLALVFAGSKTNGYAATRRLVEASGLGQHVQFLGYVPDPDMAELYRRARALVMPTFFGPTNIPPLEAFATGCPVAVSDIYAMPEQVGDAALLFDPNSDREIAGAMERLWVDDTLCRELAERGGRRLRALDQSSFATTLASILEGVAP